MGVKNNSQHQISFFNPSYCLRPPPSMLLKDMVPRIRCSANDEATISCSPFPTASKPPKPTKVDIIHHHHHRRRSCEGSEITYDHGPTSPRVGCMGQIKKNCDSNKDNLYKFRRMFSWSGRNIAMAMISPKGSSAKLVDDRRCRLGTGRAKVEDHCSRLGISIADTMDLPLPVVRHRVVSEKNVVSLWKRRGRGDHGLHDLQLQQLKVQQVECLSHCLVGTAESKAHQG